MSRHDLKNIDWDKRHQLEQTTETTWCIKFTKINDFTRISFLEAKTGRLLITFANSLDPDQARQNVGPDLNPNCLTL